MKIGYGTLYGKPTLIKIIKDGTSNNNNTSNNTSTNNSNSNNGAPQPHDIQSFTRYSKLRHKNIGVFYGVCLPPDPTCILVEHVRGCPLQVLLASPEIQLRSADRSAFALSIASGMAYLHAAGLTHRLLCPLFVVVAEDAPPAGRTCKVIHYGLYSLARSARVLPSFLVDQRFVAPEVLAGEDVDAEPARGRAADVYSFGALMCALEMARQSGSVLGFCGEVDEWCGTADKRMALVEKVLCGCDYWYGRIMKRCLAENPLKRPSFEKIVDKLAKIVLEK